MLASVSRSTTLLQSEKSQKPLEGLLCNLVHTFMFPSGGIQMFFGNPLTCLHQIKGLICPILIHAKLTTF